MSMDGITIHQQVPLRELTSLRIGGPADYLLDVHRPDALPSALAFAEARSLPWYVLGEGSNVLAADEGYHGVVIRLVTHGYKILSGDDSIVDVEVEAGENWNSFTSTCAERGWWGVENMAGIPGTTGALPVQNAGAYGQEARDTLTHLTAWDIVDQRWTELDASVCAFGYRSSMFNTSCPHRYIITSVTFSLSPQGTPHLSHTSLADYVAAHHDRQKGPVSLRFMRAAVLALRSDGRLPDVRTIGNAGSFFKNLVVGETELLAGVARMREMISAAAAEQIETLARRFSRSEGVKIPVGLLIKLCGLSECRVGGAALFSGNPLVVVNRSGRATSAEVLELASRISKSVYEKTGFQISLEPRFLGFTA